MGPRKEEESEEQVEEGETENGCCVDVWRL